MQEGRYYTLLSMLYLAFMMTSSMLSYRFVNIGPILTASCVFVIPFLYSTADIIAEMYGYAAIKQTIWYAFFVAFIMCAMLWLLVQLPFAPQFQTINNAYHVVFNPILRIYFANLLALLASIFLNVYILLAWKKRVKGRLFFIRSLFSAWLGELLFSVIVNVIVQWGVLQTRDIIEIIMVSFSVKMLFGFFSSMIIAWIVKPIIENLETGRIEEDSSLRLE